MREKVRMVMRADWCGYEGSEEVLPGRVGQRGVFASFGVTRSGRAQSGGFTLLELIVGAAISAVLLAALYGVLSGVLGMKRRSYESMGRDLPQAAATAVLKRDIMNMVVPLGRLGDVVVGEKSSEDGRVSDTLAFCTTTGTVGETTAYPNIQKVEYYLAESEGNVEYPSAQLIRAVTRNLLTTDSEETREARSLLSGVQSMELEFYDGETWTTTWDSTTAETVVPKAVRVRLTMAERDEDSGTYPEIEVVCEVASEKVS